MKNFYYQFPDHPHRDSRIIVKFSGFSGDDYPGHGFGDRSPDEVIRYILNWRRGVPDFMDTDGTRQAFDNFKFFVDAAVWSDVSEPLQERFLKEIFAEQVGILVR